MVDQAKEAQQKKGSERTRAKSSASRTSSSTAGAEVHGMPAADPGSLPKASLTNPAFLPSDESIGTSSYRKLSSSSSLPVEEGHVEGLISTEETVRRRSSGEGRGAVRRMSGESSRPALEGKTGEASLRRGSHESAAELQRRTSTLARLQGKQVSDGGQLAAGDEYRLDDLPESIPVTTALQSDAADVEGVDQKRSTDILWTSRELEQKSHQSQLNNPTSGPSATTEEPGHSPPHIKPDDILKETEEEESKSEPNDAALPTEDKTDATSVFGDHVVKPIRPKQPPPKIPKPQIPRVAPPSAPLRPPYPPESPNPSPPKREPFAPQGNPKPPRRPPYPPR